MDEPPQPQVPRASTRYRACAHHASETGWRLVVGRHPTVTWPAIPARAASLSTRQRSRWASRVRGGGHQRSSAAVAEPAQRRAVASPRCRAVVRARDPAQRATHSRTKRRGATALGRATPSRRIVQHPPTSPSFPRGATAPRLQPSATSLDLGVASLHRRARTPAIPRPR